MSVVFNIRFSIPIWLERFFMPMVLFYRRLCYGYPFRRIALSKGFYAIVDPKDFDWLNGFKWHANGQDDRIYACHNIATRYRRTKTVLMHRLIMNPPDGFLVDHESGNTLDNRRANLRLATPAQNSFNRRKTRKKTSSRFIGGYFEKCRQTWAAHITHNGKKIWLGRFKSEIDAARAYDRAAIKYHGEFARLNFPREDYNVEIQNTND
jgi:hypothetical protein